MKKSLNKAFPRKCRKKWQKTTIVIEHYKYEEKDLLRDIYNGLQRWAFKIKK